jgi:hypothetical protein
MPIIRTFQCVDCNHRLEVTLTADEWDAPAPPCPECEAHSLQQEFKPFGIGGTPYAKAKAITEDILDADYHVADVKHDKDAPTPTVRYKDQIAGVPSSSWQAAGETLQQAMVTGRQTRLQHGNGLDILQSNLKSGAEPDLIEISKRRAMRVW